MSDLTFLTAEQCFGDEKFNPCCGKVINITEKQLEQLHLVNRDVSIEDVSR